MRILLTAASGVAALGLGVGAVMAQAPEDPGPPDDVGAPEITGPEQADPQAPFDPPIGPPEPTIETQTLAGVTVTLPNGMAHTFNVPDFLASWLQEHLMAAFGLSADHVQIGQAIADEHRQGPPAEEEDDA